MMRREIDVITGNNVQLEQLYTFKNFPINMVSGSACDVNDDLLFDMDIGISPESGCIQLIDIPPEEMIYIDTHSNAIGSVWKRQHEALAREIQKYNPKRVLELGGGTGILERIYNDMDGGCNEWTIIDPQPNPINTNAKFIKGYFPEAYRSEMDFDVIVHSHVWEHIQFPREFISNISKILSIGQRMIFSVPDLKYLLKNCKTSIINFEHTIYLSDEYIDYLLLESGFEICKKVYFENHSIIYDVVKTNRRTKMNLSEMYELNKKLFETYISSHKKKINHLNDELNQKTNSVFLFGGHISSQFYIAFGLQISKIKAILDNDESKWGKRLSGTCLRIESPEVLRNIAHATVILPSSPYTKEIKEQISDSINSAVEFIEMDNL